MRGHQDKKANRGGIGMEFGCSQALFQEEGRILQELRDKASRLDALPDLSLDSFPVDFTAVLVIDLTEGFAKEGALASERVKELILPAKDFLCRCKERGFAVFAVNDCHTASSPELSCYPAHCMSGTREAELCSELAGLVDEVYHKNSTNALLSREVAELVLKGFRDFIIIGCLTDLCIYQCAVTLRAWLNEKNCGDSRVVVPLALVDTYEAAGHHALLANLVFGCSMEANGIILAKHIK